jgi:hypothetical protein
MALLFIFGVFTADRLKEIDFRKLRLLLYQIRDAKKDLAVTRAEIDALTQDIAFVSMSLLSDRTITSLEDRNSDFWRLQSEIKKAASKAGLSNEAKQSFGLTYRLEKLLSRERSRQLAVRRIAQILRRSGWKDERIAEFSAPAHALTTENVLDNVRAHIYSHILNQMYKLFDSGKIPRPKGETWNPKDYVPMHEVYAALSQPSTQTVVKALLEPRYLWSPQMEELLGKYESFCDEFPFVKQLIEPLDPDRAY